MIQHQVRGEDDQLSTLGVLAGNVQRSSGLDSAEIVSRSLGLWGDDAGKGWQEGWLVIYYPFVPKYKHLSRINIE